MKVSITLAWLGTYFSLLLVSVLCLWSEVNVSECTCIHFVLFEKYIYKLKFSFCKLKMLLLCIIIVTLRPNREVCSMCVLFIYCMHNRCLLFSFPYTDKILSKNNGTWYSNVSCWIWIIYLSPYPLKIYRSPIEFIYSFKLQGYGHKSKRFFFLFVGFQSSILRQLIYLKKTQIKVFTPITIRHLFYFHSFLTFKCLKRANIQNGDLYLCLVISCIWI